MKKPSFPWMLLALALASPSRAQAETPEPAGMVGAVASDSPADVPPSRADGVNAAAATEADGDSWADHLRYNIFADVFYQYDWNRPVNQTAMTNVPHRAYEYTNGFGLAFAGVDAAYTGQHVGATISLRYGVGAQRYLIGGSVGYNGDPTDPTGSGAPTAGVGGNIASLAAVKQAYGTYLANDALTVDLGLFDTFYGAEVADSWMNANYTRSPLNYLLQPFYHLGVRATYELDDSLVFRAMVANPTNAYTSFNGLPYVGAQLGFLSDHVSLYGGYMTGSTGLGSDQRGPFEHFVDLIATVTAGDVTLTGNFDLWHHPSDARTGVVEATAYGFSVVGSYRASERLRFAGRFDYVDNSQGYMATGSLPPYALVVGTATLDVRPVGDRLVLRLEHRYEHATQNVFIDHDSTSTGAGMRNSWMSTTLSAVVRTGN